MNTAFKCGLLAFLVLALVGCDKSPQTIAARGAKAFQSAPPEVKADWDSASSALNSNDLVGAVTNLAKLQVLETLTPDQGQVVRETSAALNDRIHEAANKGDASAKAALDELRKMRSR